MCPLSPKEINEENKQKIRRKEQVFISKIQRGDYPLKMKENEERTISKAQAVGKAARRFPPKSSQAATHMMGGDLLAPLARTE